MEEKVAGMPKAGKNAKERGASTFSVTFNLLSQYLKENKAGFGGISDITSAGLGKAEAFRPPTTMSLLPGVDVDVMGNEEGDNGNDVSGRNTMELFPQRAEFGRAAPVAVADDAKRADAREAEKDRLTIFYGGKVLVFDNFPAEKAWDLMQLAGRGNSIINNQNNGFAMPSTADARPNVAPQLNPTALPTTTVSIPAAGQHPRQAQLTDLPMARNASLHRFFEKRKDRIKARAPYQVNASPASLVVKKEEEQSWLGLGPVVSKPSGRTSESSR